LELGIKNGEGKKMNKFLEEIYEQPKALRDTLAYYVNGEGKKSIDKLSKIWKSKKFNEIVFTGMGSSFFASQSASCLLGKYGIKSFVINASEFLHYHGKTIDEHTLLVCVSQSGESYEIVKLLENIPANVHCVGICNEEESTLAKKSSECFLSRAGKEEMTSTKTFVSTLLTMFVLSLTIADDWNVEKASELNNTISVVEKLLESQNEWLLPSMKILNNAPFVQVVGRGPSYSSVLQGALMFMEGARNPAAGIFGGEFRHGPMEMVKKGFKAILFAPLGKTYDQSIKMAEDIVKFGGQVVLVTNDEKKYDNENIYSIQIPYKEEYFFAIPAIIPLQFIVNQWAVGVGLEPGSFTRGAKVTTIE
jgi:glutamine---fructose-6-phosphate transaminase (isomerizing)